jgi:hypothetical protein
MPPASEDMNICHVKVRLGLYSVGCRVLASFTPEGSTAGKAFS